MSYHDLDVPTHKGPLYELLGFNAGPLVAGGIEGLSTFSLTSAESTAAMSELAVRAALLGSTERLPGGQFDQLSMQLAVSRELADPASGDALARVIDTQREEWNQAVNTSLKHANLALLEAVVFDVLGGFPSDKEISKLEPESAGENLYWSDQQKARTLQAKMHVGNIALHGGRSAEYIEAKAVFREAGDSAETQDDLLEPYYNRYLGGKWHLDHLVLWHRNTLDRVGMAAVDETIRNTRVIFKTHYFFKSQEVTPTLVAINLQEGHKSGTASYYSRSDQDNAKSVRGIGSVRLGLDEFRRLVAPGPATQVIATNAIPVHHEGPLELEQTKTPGILYRARLALSEAIRPKN